ncbi:MAG TPA: transcription antitermination factor NusB [Nitrospirales bacterium]|nr:transcription antitermination factor NusB [Nitrospirales bacterium]HIC04556.1 transcription antitermination factor NusB [Nitrospirales bacterium]HIO70122.1 transcription antitermination factor NusB [Nitrospirales bacterium]
MGRRRTARTLALQALYQWNLQQRQLTQPWDSWNDQDTEPAAIDFAKTLVEGVIQHRDSIDAAISKHAHHWAMDRLSVVDRNVLRIAVFELLYLEDIPSAVTINEAIEIAKQFGDDESGGFVNGILDGLSKSQRVAKTSG